MSNFRIKVFYSVANHLSFTKAAEELFITQPAVTKNIKELEQELNVNLFERKGNRILLTEAGQITLNYAQNILALENQLHFDLSVLSNKYSGQLKLGASTTIGQYVLPPVLAQFKQKYPDVELSLINDNTQKIEDAIIEKRIELGIVEGSSKNNQLKYVPFINDEIVAIAHTSQTLSSQDEIDLNDLKSIPLVLRETGSGSLEVISEELKKHRIKLNDLNIIMHLGSTESIKTFLANSNSIGLISINAVTKEIANGEFKVIDIKDFDILRTFYFVHPHGKSSGFADKFIQFSKSHYNQKL